MFFFSAKGIVVIATDSFGGFDSFSIKPTTVNATEDTITADNTGNNSLYSVPPKTPANAGPTIKPRLADIDSLPKFLLLSLSVETSARYALATEMLPPVIPSKALAKKITIR